MQLGPLNANHINLQQISQNGIPINIGLNGGPLLSGENTYFIGEDNIISIGTIPLEKAVKDVNSADPLDNLIEIGKDSPSYQNDLSVAYDISEAPVAQDGTPNLKKEEELETKSMIKKSF